MQLVKRGQNVYLVDGAIESKLEASVPSDLSQLLINFGPFGPMGEFWGYSAATHVLYVMTDSADRPLVSDLLRSGTSPIYPQRAAIGGQGTIDMFWKNKETKPVTRKLAAAIQYFVEGSQLVITHMSVLPKWRRHRLNTLLVGWLEAKHPGLTTVFDDPTRDGKAFMASRPTQNPPLESKFIATNEILEQVRDADPTYGHMPDEPDGEEYRARRVTWVGSPGLLVQIPAKNVLFMEGNNWYFGHAAALLEKIHEGDCRLGVPAARVYRIDASHVKQSQKFEKAGELEHQLNMTEPWKRDEQGEYYAQLLDGNHRAAAALAAGEPFIYVYVGENYRENIRKKDWE